MICFPSLQRLIRFKSTRMSTQKHLPNSFTSCSLPISQPCCKHSQMTLMQQWLVQTEQNARPDNAGPFAELAYAAGLQDSFVRAFEEVNIITPCNTSDLHIYALPIQKPFCQKGMMSCSFAACSAMLSVATGCIMGSAISLLTSATAFVTLSHHDNFRRKPL